MKLIPSFLLANYFFFSKVAAFIIGHQYFRLKFKLARKNQKSMPVYLMICFLFFFNFMIMSFMLKFRIISSLVFNLVDMCVLVFGHRSNIIGLTGGIGCGKSTVCEILKKYKAIIIDADKISKSVTQSPAVLNKIKKIFGEDVFNQDNKTLDRKALGDIIFKDRSKKRLLQRITHPRILFKILQQMIYYKVFKRHQLVVLDAPLLYESKILEYFLSPIGVVHVKDKQMQIQRVANRDGRGYQDAQNRVNSQMPMEVKMKKADLLIDNSEGIKELVMNVHDNFLNKIFSID